MTAFGIVLVCIGALSALLGGLAALGTIIAARFAPAGSPAASTAMTGPALLFYLGAAVWFIWLGIGSVLARRWARALILVGAWLTLVMGFGGVAVLGAFLPKIRAHMLAHGVPGRAAAVTPWAIMGGMIAFFIVGPAVFILFYGRSNVRETCERRNPQVSWTDSCPLPVLAVSLAAAYGAVKLLLTGFYGWVIPFFGTVASGGVGAVVALVGAAFLAYTAWGAYRLRIAAWWCAAILTYAWGISASMTFSRVPLAEFWGKMRFSAGQMEQMKEFGLAIPPSTILYSALCVAGMLGYLLYTRRFFLRPGRPKSPGA